MLIYNNETKLYTLFLNKFDNDRLSTLKRIDNIDEISKELFRNDINLINIGEVDEVQLALQINQNFIDHMTLESISYFHVGIRCGSTAFEYDIELSKVLIILVTKLKYWCGKNLPTDLKHMMDTTVDCHYNDYIQDFIDGVISKEVYWRELIRLMSSNQFGLDC